MDEVASAGAGSGDACASFVRISSGICAFC